MPQQDMILSGEISFSLRTFLLELSFGKNHVVIHLKTEKSEICFLHKNSGKNVRL